MSIIVNQRLFANFFFDLPEINWITVTNDVDNLCNNIPETFDCWFAACDIHDDEALSRSQIEVSLQKWPM